MSNYTKATNFGIKDSLTSGDPQKVIKGVEFDAEFTSIQTATNSKANISTPIFTGAMTAETATFSGAITALSIDGGTY